MEYHLGKDDIIEGMSLVAKDPDELTDVQKAKVAGFREFFKTHVRNEQGYINENDNDYEINPVQYKKFLEVAEYFQKLADEDEGELLPIEFRPSDRNVTVTIKNCVVGVAGCDKVFEFCQHLNGCLSFGVESRLNTDNVMFSITIKDVFRKRQQ